MILGDLEGALLTVLGLVVSGALTGVGLYLTSRRDRKDEGQETSALRANEYGVVGDLAMQLASKMEEAADRERDRCEERINHMEAEMAQAKAHIARCDLTVAALVDLAAEAGLDVSHISRA